MSHRSYILFQTFPNWYEESCSLGVGVDKMRGGFRNICGKKILYHINSSVHATECDWSLFYPRIFLNVQCANN